mgnify:CR=1 FL=1
MTDEEVGELWTRLLGDCVRLDACYNHGDMFRLICKLVDERSRVYSNYDRYKAKHVPQALQDFGIDPATWKTRTEEKQPR